MVCLHSSNWHTCRLTASIACNLVAIYFFCLFRCSYVCFCVIPSKIYYCLPYWGWICVGWFWFGFSRTNESKFLESFVAIAICIFDAHFTFSLHFVCTFCAHFGELCVSLIHCFSTFVTLIEYMLKRRWYVVRTLNMVKVSHFLPNAFPHFFVCVFRSSSSH